MQRVKTNQSGNALFLILIAVILFAALSYAITQSNRSGGDPASEVNLVGAAAVVQQSEGMRQAVIRMIVKGASVDQLDFAPLEAGDPAFNTPPFTYKVFHPQGGGAIYPKMDPAVTELDSGGLPTAIVYGDKEVWDLNLSLVGGIGTSEKDVVAVMVNVKKSVCEAINQKLTGSKAIPTVDNINQSSKISYVLSGADITGAGIDGNASLCVTGQLGTDYAYYNVLVER